MTDRPASVLTVQSEAPPPYTEYDDSSPAVPEPNAETQAMLRGGYMIHRNQLTPQQSLHDESPSAVYIRGRRHTGTHNDLITIARAIHPAVTVEGIPFPSEYPAVLSSRDVKPEDWKFFATSIVDELEVQAPKGFVSTPLSLIEFRERQDAIDAVVEQWNTTFFASRGIHVVPAYSFGRRLPSPTPTYRTSQPGVSEAAEIETVTFDTSPRSTRAPTPDTIRDFELNHVDNGGRTTPKLERASFVPTITGLNEEAAHQQSSFEDEFGEQLRLDEEYRFQQSRETSSPAGATEYIAPAAAKHDDKARHRSNSSSSSSVSLSSIDTISSGDELAYGDVPAIRRTLAEEFRRDPNNMTHLKEALTKIRTDVKSQQAFLMNTSNKLERKSMQAASKEHRKGMRAEMKELRKEIKSYHKIAKIHKKDERDAKKQQRKQSKSEWKASRREQRDVRKSDRRSRKRDNKVGASQLNLIPEQGAASSGNHDWRDTVPGPSSAWPFGRKGSGLPEETIPAGMEKGWPWGGDMAGWPWDNKLGAHHPQYPANWPLNGRRSGPEGTSPSASPTWPLNKTHSAPVTRKPVPPRRPGTSPSPTPPGEIGSPGASNAAASPLSHSSHGTHLSPSASFPATTAARVASRTPSPGPAPPSGLACPTQRFNPWAGHQARGFGLGADWTGGRGRGFGGQPDMQEHFGFGRGRGRHRSHSGEGRGGGRGFGRGRSGSEDATLVGMARNFLIQQAQDGLERLRPMPNLDHGPAQRAGSTPESGQSRTDGNGQETGVAHR